jgi:hypothetical protein
LKLTQSFKKVVKDEEEKNERVSDDAPRPILSIQTPKVVSPEDIDVSDMVGDVV